MSRRCYKWMLASTGSGPQHRRRHRRDIAIAGPLFLIAVMTGWVYCRFYPVNPHYYQASFTPAVMFASGHGLVNADVSAPPQIREFLELKRDHLNAAEVPRPNRVQAFDSLQNASRYLLLSVGLWWRLTGISWRGV